MVGGRFFITVVSLSNIVGILFFIHTRISVLCLWWLHFGCCHGSATWRVVWYTLSFSWVLLLSQITKWFSLQRWRLLVTKKRSKWSVLEYCKVKITKKRRWRGRVWTTRKGRPVSHRPLRGRCSPPLHPDTATSNTSMFLILEEGTCTHR